MHRDICKTLLPFLLGYVFWVVFCYTFCILWLDLSCVLGFGCLRFPYALYSPVFFVLSCFSSPVCILRLNFPPTMTLSPLVMGNNCANHCSIFPIYFFHENRFKAQIEIFKKKKLLKRQAMNCDIIISSIFDFHLIREHQTIQTTPIPSGISLTAGTQMPSHPWLLSWFPSWTKILLSTCEADMTYNSIQSGTELGLNVS